MRLSYIDACKQPGRYKFIVASTGRQTNDRAHLLVRQNGTTAIYIQGQDPEKDAKPWTTDRYGSWVYERVGNAPNNKRKLLLLEHP